MDEHVKLVEVFLQKLLAAQLYVKLSKCKFHPQIGLTRLPVSHEGVEMHPEMVQAVLEREGPCAWKQLQSFLGFVNFYRQFIPTFAQIPLPAW